MGLRSHREPPGTTAGGFGYEVVLQPEVSTAMELPICTPSNARLKTNIAQLTDVLEKLEQTRGVSFEWNDTIKAKGMAGEGSDIGVNAQEVEAVFPELVSTYGLTETIAFHSGDDICREYNVKLTEQFFWDSTSMVTVTERET